MVREMCWKGNRWGVEVGYMRENGKKLLNRLVEINKEKREINGWLLGRDFNARTGERGEIEDREEEKRRRSKDKKVNKEGEVLLGWLEEEGWDIINGTKEGDEEGEWTFTKGREDSVIDYVIGNRVA